MPHNIIEVYNTEIQNKKNLIRSTKLEILRLTKRKNEEQCNIAKSFRQQHKKMFIIMDTIIVLCIILNLCALFMTNALVIKNNPAKTFKEVNPVQCSMNGFSCAGNFFSGIWIIIKQILLWAIIVAMYINNRNKITSEFMYYVSLASVLALCTALSFDVINDLGFYVGKMIWGIK